MSAYYPYQNGSQEASSSPSKITIQSKQNTMPTAAFAFSPSSTFLL